MLGSPAAPVLRARLRDGEAAWPVLPCLLLGTCGLWLQWPPECLPSASSVWGQVWEGSRSQQVAVPQGGQGLPVQHPRGSVLPAGPGDPGAQATFWTYTFTSQRLASLQGRGSERRASGGGAGAATALRPLVPPPPGFCDEAPSPTAVGRGRSQRQAALSPWTWAPRTAWSAGQASQCQ